jgi:hypothetical protein
MTTSKLTLSYVCTYIYITQIIFFNKNVIGNDNIKIEFIYLNSARLQQIDYIKPAL